MVSIQMNSAVALKNLRRSGDLEHRVGVAAGRDELLERAIVAIKAP